MKWSVFWFVLALVGCFFLFSDFVTHLGQTMHEVTETLDSVPSAQQVCRTHPNSLLYKETCRKLQKWGHVSRWTIPFAVMWEAAKHTAAHVAMPDGTNILLWMFSNIWSIGIVAFCVCMLCAGASCVGMLRSLHAIADKLHDPAVRLDLEAGAVVKPKRV
jgi:hypothetical protein